MTQKNTNTSAGEFITSRGAAQVAPATAFEGVSPRERHSPAPPAPPETATATVDQAETLAPQERHSPTPTAPTNPTDPTIPTAPTTPPVTPADAQVDATTDAPAEGGAPTADTSGSPVVKLEDEIVTMERHSPTPPRD